MGLLAYWHISATLEYTLSVVRCGTLNNRFWLSFGAMFRFNLIRANLSKDFNTTLYRTSYGYGYAEICCIHRENIIRLFPFRCARTSAVEPSDIDYFPKSPKSFPQRREWRAWHLRFRWLFARLQHYAKGIDHIVWGSLGNYRRALSPCSAQMPFHTPMHAYEAVYRRVATKI